MQGPMVGFTGPRRLPDLFLPDVLHLVRAVVASKRQIVVGCAHGLDEKVRYALKTYAPEHPLRVFQAHEPCPHCDGKRHFWDRPKGDESPEEWVWCQSCGGSGCRFGKDGYRFARRSQAMVEAISAAGPGSALIGFPDRRCPGNILPEGHWIGGKPVSGTWSSLAMAAALGVPVILNPCTTGPAEELVPAHWPGSWGPTAGSGVWASTLRYRREP